MRRIRHLRPGGIALIATVSILALLSVMMVALIATTSLESSLGGNYVLQTRAQLAAESGIDRAIASLNALPAGPVPDAFWAAAAGEELEVSPGCRVAYRATDESAKLNVNDPDPVTTANDGRGRLEIVTGILVGLLLNDNARGDTVAMTVFRDPAVGRARHGGSFPSLAALHAALAAAGLSPADTDRILEHVTIRSWRDESVIQTNAGVHGKPDGDGVYPGAALTDMLDQPIDRWSEFQTRVFKLEPRAPVNLNGASRELLQALIQPLQGAFLEEGPAENQSSEHYGWWSAGDAAGSRDPNVNKFGVIRRTPPLTEEQASLLAQAMHDRIHGVANPELLTPDQQPDADADGEPDPNPFETWEEFRDFLERGICGAPDLDDGSPAYRIFAGAGFGFDPAAHIPQPYTATCAWRDPHAAITDPAGVTAFSNTWRGQFRDKPVVNPWTNTAELEARITRWCNRYYAGFVRDVIYANFNPNSLLNDWNPDASACLGVDKAQLLVSTTEGCFAPTGIFGIAAEGRVLGDTDAPLAVCRIRCDTQILVPLKLTTQADFLRHLRIENSDADLTHYFSAATLPQPAAWYGWAHASPNGRLGLQSYPEPVYPGPDGTLAAPLSRFDGALRLADVELLPRWDNIGKVTAIGDFNGNDESPLHLDGVQLRAAEYAQFGGPCPEAIPDPHRNDKNKPLAAALTPATPADAPGSLYPDGAYSESGRVIGYKLGNLNACSAANANRAMMGAVLFWIKPNFHTGIPARIRKLFTGPSRPGVYCPQQFAALYYLANPCSTEEDGLLDPAVPAANRIAMRMHYAGYDPFNPGFQSGGSGTGGVYGNASRNSWAPSRCLVFGAAWQDGAVTGANYRQFMLCDTVSAAMTRDYPCHDSGQVPARGVLTPLQQTLRGHCWTHLALAWYLHNGSTDANGADAKKRLSIHINGLPLPYYLTSWTTARPYSTSNNWKRFERRESNNPYLTTQNATQAFVTENLNAEWFRFGELPAGGAGGDYASPSASPYAADSTVDTIACLWGPNTATVAGEPKSRYINLALPGPAGAAPTLAEYTSPRIALETLAGPGVSALRLHSIAWTFYRPRYNTAAVFNQPVGIFDNINGVAVNTTDKPDPIAHRWAADTGVPAETKQTWDAVSIDFRDSTGVWHYADSGRLNERMTYAGGSICGDAASTTYGANDMFQFRAAIHLAAGQMLYESPVLDEVVCVFHGSVPRILTWTVER